MIERVPIAPRKYSAAITRSDGSSSKIYVNGARRRIDSYRGGQLERITIAHPAEGEIRTYRMQAHECLITPAPKESDEVSAAVDADAVFTPAGGEPVGPFLCTKFEVVRAGHLSELRWYDDRSGLCIQTQTFDTFGNAVLRIELTEISLEEPPESVFERLHGFREIRLRM